MTPTKRPIILPGDAEVYGNLDAKGNEIQNANMQNLQTAPQDASEGRYYMDTVNHKPMIHNGTGFVSFGETYTEGTGIDIGNDNSITVTDYNKLLKNRADSNSSNTLNIGFTNSSNDGDYNVVIGYGANNNYSDYGVTIGSSSEVYNTNCIAIGSSSSAGDVNTPNAFGRSIAIGYNAKVTGSNSIQIGEGTNSLYRTFNVSFSDDNNNPQANWQMLDGVTGLIPDARMSSNIARSSDIPTVPTALSGFTDDLGSSPTHTHSQYLNSSLKGANNGLAELDASGKVPSSQLPAYVDDVIDLKTVSSSAPSTCAKGDKYYNTSSSKIFTATATNTWGSTGATPESDIIYVATDTNATYRWSGSTMVNLSNPIGQATESSAGIAEIATTSEVSTGTDDTRMVTPLKLAGALLNYASATKTLTNTTFNANGTGNSISNLEVADFASGVVRTQSDGIRSVSNASDTTFATEKAIADAIKNFITGISSSDVTTALGFTPVKKYATNNPALTVTNNYGTWTINTGISSSDLNVNFYDITNDGNSVIYPSYNVNNGVVTAWFYSTSNISADKIRVVVTG